MSASHLILIAQPTEEALVLMRRTATHLLSASNPAQLEMRILANHGADERFSFLRDGGRWHQSWLEIKAETKAAKEQETKKAVGLGGIVGYGSESDSDEDTEMPPPPESAVPSEPPAPPPPLPDPQLSADLDTESEVAKEQRRARAREWMLNRRKEKETGV